MTRIFLFCLLLFIPFSEVHADDVFKKAYLSCDTENNAAMVRLDAGYVNKPRYLELPDPYSKFEYLNDFSLNDQCTLKDGRTIALSYDEGQAFAYGAGGGDPPAYFYLKVGDRYAYFHKAFYGSYNAEFIDPSVIIINGANLISCKGSNGFSDKAGPSLKVEKQNCQDETQRLVLGVDAYPAELRSLKENNAQEIYKEISKNHELCEFIKIKKIHDFANTQKFNFNSYKKTPLGYVLESSIDINNDNKMDKILQFGATSHYMDGVYFIVGDEKTTDSVLKCVVEKNCPSEFRMPNEGYADVDRFLEIIGQHWLDAYALSGTDLSDIGYRARYTNLYPVTFGGKNYVYFEPLNETSFPRAAVGEILPDRKLDVVCTYKELPNGG